MLVYCAHEDVLHLFPDGAGARPQETFGPFIEMASAWVENVTQRILLAQTYTEESRLIMSRDREIVGKARQWPIQSVQAVAVRISGTQTPVPLDVSYVDYLPPPERLFWYRGPLTPLAAGGAPWAQTGGGFSREARGVLITTYTGGYATPPADLRLATALRAWALSMHDANMMGATAIATPSAGSVQIGQTDAYTRQALDLLRPYIRRD